MTYKESDALTKDQEFRGRVKIACLKFADYIVNEAPNVAAHTTRFKWATRTQGQPDIVAGEVQPPTVMDAAVQAAGAEITDAALQTAVETTVNRLL